MNPIKKSVLLSNLFVVLAITLVVICGWLVHTEPPHSISHQALFLIFALITMFVIMAWNENLRGIQKMYFMARIPTISLKEFVKFDILDSSNYRILSLDQLPENQGWHVLLTTGSEYISILAKPREVRGKFSIGQIVWIPDYNRDVHIAPSDTDIEAKTLSGNAKVIQANVE